MGRFFSTVQIKDNMGRTRFINSFCDVMKKRGFVPCSEDEAAMSYLLAFSDGGWVTLTSEGYADNSKQAYDEAKQIAAEMKTSSFALEVVDSDFAILKLCGISGDSDTVIVGDGSGYGIEDAPKGERECWEPILADGMTWEQLSENWKKDEVFVEDTLCGSAPMLGIEPKYMAADYEELSDKAESDTNIVPLYFNKTADGTKNKPMTLNAAFNKVFGEGLEPLGFKRLKKIKNKQPYFVRVVGDEILHIITYRQLTSPKLGYKCTEVLGGVVTLYRRNLDFIYSSNEATGYLMTVNNFYRSEHHFKTIFNLDVDASVIDSAIQFWCNLWGRDKNEVVKNDVWGRRKEQIPKYETTLDAAFGRSCRDFLCKSDDSEAMLYGLENAFNVTKSIILAVLDKVTDLDSCVNYFYNTHQYRAWMDLCQFDEFITNDRYSTSEGLILIKTGYRDDGVERMEKELAARIPMLGSRATQEEIDETRKNYEDYRARQVAFRDEMLDKPELNKRVMEELERCKANNIEMLKSHGIIIDKQ